jgi:hypothetical protein
MKTIRPDGTRKIPRAARREQVAAILHEMRGRLKRLDSSLAAAHEENLYLIETNNRLIEENQQIVKEHNNLIAEFLALAQTVRNYSKSKQEFAVIDGGRVGKFDPWRLGPLSDAGDRGELEPRKLAEYIDTLIWLRRVTDPAKHGEAYLRAGNNEAAEVGLARAKTILADIAIKLAAELFRNLVGWAIDHRIGTELLPPDEETVLTDDPRVNHHRFELWGNEMRWATINLVEARFVAHELLTMLLDVYPSRVAESLEASMTQVLVGSDAALFRPARRRKNKSRDAFVSWSLRLRAVGHVYHRTARGTKKGDAVAKVAKAYSVSSEAVQNWETRLPEVIGGTMTDNLWRNACSAASIAFPGAPFSDAELEKYGDLYQRYHSAAGLSEVELKSLFPQLYQ